MREASGSVVECDSEGHLQELMVHCGRLGLPVMWHTRAWGGVITASRPLYTEGEGQCFASGTSKEEVAVYESQTLD